MAFCPNCGASSPDGSRFCVECGTKLEAAPVFIDPPVPEIEPELPEVPTMDIPVPELPSVEPEVPAAPAFAAESAPAPETAPAAPAPMFESAPAASPAFEAPASQPQSVYQKPAPAASAHVPPEADPERPGKKSKFAPMTSWGMAIQLILMNIPVIGFVLMVVWACGGCRKIARRNLARANLILLILGIIVVIIAALLARFAFSDVITSVFEQLLPGYTLQWS